MEKVCKIRFCSALLAVCVLIATIPISTSSKATESHDDNQWQVRIDTQFSNSSQDARDGLFPAEIDYWAHEIALLNKPDEHTHFGAGVIYSELTYEDQTSPLLFLPSARSVTESVEVFFESLIPIASFQLHSRLTIGDDDHAFSRPDPFSGLTARANTSGHHFLGEVDFYTDLEILDGILLRPIIGADFVSTTIDPMVESGAGAFNLAIAQTRDNRLRSEVGALLGTVIKDSAEGRLAVGGTVQWIRNFNTDPVLTNASTLGGFPIGEIALFPGLDRDGALVNGGVFWQAANGAELTLGYEGEFYSSLQSHTFSAQLKMPIIRR